MVSLLTEDLNNLTVQETTLQFSTEELQAFVDVRKGLLLKDLKPTDFHPREIAIVTMLSKCRVDKAIEKYIQFIQTIGEFDLDVNVLYQDLQPLREKMNANYQVCGKDKGNRSIMWISSSTPTQVSEEKITVHSGVLYWMAVHSDLHTLREGCTFVIDTSKQKGINKVGNERKMQKTWQALPLRPQNLFIVGASFLKRIFINALISFASIFSNSKVLARIRFVEMPEVRTEVPDSSMPEELGGDKRSAVDQWVEKRLSLWNNFVINDSDKVNVKDGEVKDNDADTK